MTPQVLLVDDEPAVRRTIKTFLQQIGCLVMEADGFDAALALLEALEFDVLICDIFLPRRSGLEILRHVNREGRSFPVIMITGSPLIESAAEALRLGAFDYISKPIARDGIVHVVRRALEFRRISEQNDRLRSDLEAIFSSVQDGIVSLDRHFRIKNVNGSASAICGFGQEALGKSFRELDLECGKSCQGVVETALHTRRGAETRYFSCGKRAGEEQFVSVSVAPLRVSPTQVDGAVMVVRDETSLYRLEKHRQQRSSFAGLTGKSHAMQHLYSMIERLADVPSTVLIIGENGTGKELIAGALHETGARRGRPFVKVNCAALSENLLESELFGHVRGAFTGAVRDRSGLFEKAHGGTILLDEIGDISPALQVKLLRVLQEREFERVGGSSPIKVDVRVIAATNKELSEEVAAGRFRQDLYYRLKVVELRVPPLRERAEDIPLLAKAFLRKLNARLSKNLTSVSPEAVDVLKKYRWPGNVRELEHALEYASIMCTTRTILPHDLPAGLMEQPSGAGAVSLRDEIVRTLEAAAGNKARTARILKMDRKTLYRKLKEFHIPTSGPKGAPAC